MKDLHITIWLLFCPLLLRFCDCREVTFVTYHIQRTDALLGYFDFDREMCWCLQRALIDMIENPITGVRSDTGEELSLDEKDFAEKLLLGRYAQECENYTNHCLRVLKEHKEHNGTEIDMLVNHVAVFMSHQRQLMFILRTSEAKDNLEKQQDNKSVGSLMSCKGTEPSWTFNLKASKEPTGDSYDIQKLDLLSKFLQPCFLNALSFIALDSMRLTELDTTEGGESLMGYVYKVYGFYQEAVMILLPQLRDEFMFQGASGERLNLLHAFYKDFTGLFFNSCLSSAEYLFNTPYLTRLLDDSLDYAVKLRHLKNLLTVQFEYRYERTCPMYHKYYSSRNMSENPLLTNEIPDYRYYNLSAHTEF